jgi:membrane-associated phospholipid phosphatase
MRPKALLPACWLCAALLLIAARTNAQDTSNSDIVFLNLNSHPHSLTYELRPTPVVEGATPTISAGVNEAGSAPDLNLFGNIGNNFLHSFKGGNLYLQVSAVGATALLVPTDVDYRIEHYFNTHPQYTGWSNAVNYTGQDLPFIVGGGLLAYAELAGNNEVLGASFAVIQASLIAVVYNSALKAFTGRPGPRWQYNSDMEALSETFRFGFLRGGIYWGWPSGHTVASMAVVSALTSYYPNSTWLKIAGYGIVGYTMAAVSAHNRGGMHWFSDAVAGALISYTIGSSVGSYFRSVYSGGAGAAATSTGLTLSPTLYPAGISLSYRF